MDYTHDLAAKLHTPKPETDNNKLVIMLPGFLFSKDHGDWPVLGDRLAEIGYTSVRFDPTGTWESGGDIADYNLTQYMEDIDYVLDFMTAEKEYEKIILVGRSLGGLVAQLYAAENPENVDAFAAIVSPGKFHADVTMQKKLEEWKEKGFKESTRPDPLNKGSNRHFILPYSFVEDAHQYDVKDVIDKLTMPKLYISGEKDEVVDPKITQELSELAPEPKTFKSLPVGHDYRKDPKQMKLVHDQVLDFLSKLT